MFSCCLYKAFIAIFIVVLLLLFVLFEKDTFILSHQLIVTKEIVLYLSIMTNIKHQTHLFKTVQCECMKKIK